MWYLLTDNTCLNKQPSGTHETKLLNTALIPHLNRLIKFHTSTEFSLSVSSHDGNVMFGKVHMSSDLSLWYFLWNVLKIVTMLVCDLTQSQYSDIHIILDLQLVQGWNVSHFHLCASFLQATNAVILRYVLVHKVSQQTSCDVCCACKSVSLFLPLAQAWPGHRSTLVLAALQPNSSCWLVAKCLSNLLAYLKDRSA